MSGSYHLKCKSCGAINRAPESKIDQKAKCAKCSSPLAANDVVVINVTDATWDKEIHQATIPTIVEVWGKSCGVCHNYEPQLRQMAKNLYGKARVLTLQAELNPMISDLYKIRGVPTLLLFKEGKFHQALVGPQPEGAVRKSLGV
jgi:thioredoxin 2